MDAETTITAHLRVRAAALWLPPSAVVTGRSAATVWGVELADPDDPVEVMSAYRLRARPGMVIRTGSLDGNEITVRRGIPLTRPLHTAWEIARTLPRLEAVGWIDALARRQRLTRRELRAHGCRHFGGHGSARAASVLTLADPRAESPPESRLRVQLIEAGLPVPVPQFIVLVDGYFVARVDLAWPAYRFAVEYDGQWHADTGQLHRDRARLRDLNAAGWYVFHVTREDMADVPRLGREIAALLRKRAGVIGAKIGS